MILGNGEWITAADLPYQNSSTEEKALEDSLNKALEVYESIHIERIFKKTDGNKKRAAELLGLSLSTLYRKLEKLGIVNG